MRWPRFPLAGLMAIVAIVAVGITAMSRPSKLWASALFTSCVVVLSIALVGVVGTRGRRQLFWSGFCICGWVYFLFAFGPWFREQTGPYLLSTAAFDLLFWEINPPEPSSGLNITTLGPRNPREAWTRSERLGGMYLAGPVVLGSPDPFLRIGNSLACLLVGLLGGWSGLVFSDRSAASR